MQYIYLKDALILRLSITNYPFDYKKAINNVYSSLIYNKDFAKYCPYCSMKRCFEYCGKRQTIYNFAKKDNQIKKINYQKIQAILLIVQ